MNIKSNLSTPILWFKSISAGTLLAAIILGTILSIAIVWCGYGPVLKLLFLAASAGITLVAAYDNHDPKEEQDALAKKFGMTVLLSFIVAEIGLYYSSDYTHSIPMTVVVTEESKTEVLKRDGDGNVLESKEIPFKRVILYNLNNNKKMDYEIVYEGQEEKLKFLTNIVAQDFYIEYTPFIMYDEQFKYRRRSDK